MGEIKRYDDLTETQIDSEEIYNGVVCHLYRDRVRLQNGEESVREVLRDCRAVCVLPLDSDGCVTMVSQYRYAHSKVLLEIPAGKLDEGEDFLEAAKRELREETGAVSGKMTYLGVFYSSPAILDEKIHMYLAEGLEYGETDPDDDEFIESVKIPIDTLVDMIMRGEVPDGKTQAAVMRAAYLLKSRNA